MVSSVARFVFDRLGALSAPKPARSRRARAGSPARLLLAAAALLQPACFSSAPALAPATGGPAAPEGAPLGEFELSGDGLARGTIAPSKCTSGDLEHFLGADLTDEALGLVVRLVVDPLLGPALRVHSVEAPFERAILFFHEECERFEMSLAPTGWIINDVYVRELELDVDCVNEEGATLTGHATARCG
jgi:hypothetical protein